MRELFVAGLIALAFGAFAYVGTRGATESLNWFPVANLALGGLALLTAALAALRRLRAWLPAGQRGVVGRGLVGVLAALAVAVALERAAEVSGVQFDWTVERKYQLSEATLRALESLEDEVAATLYYDPEDPRVRSTRLLLRTLAGTGRVRVDERRLDESPEEVDRYGVSSSNSVVLQVGDRFETIGRPSEGTVYEALYRLRSVQAGLLLVARGTGEGDIERSDDPGFSGLAQALVTEGYRLRGFVPAQGLAVPEAAAAVIFLAPRRRLPPATLEALQDYLARGGRLVAFLEPGVDSGLEEVLAAWGMESPDALLVDPASGRMDGDAPGVNPLAYLYGSHPITRGLDASRMTFFRGARSFSLRKPEVDDDLWDLVLASPRSWLSSDLTALSGGEAPTRPASAPQDYHPIAVAGRFPRGDQETRIVAFGDADFASNRQLRTLYNLDLVLNAVHWVTSRESEIKGLPKAHVSQGAQFALPIQNTLTRFYGVGLLIPELLLIAGALMWLRTRSA